MPFKGSSQINPNALKNDYSGFERAAAIKAQTMAGLGQAISQGYKAHKQKMADKAEAERALEFTGLMMEQMGYEGDPEAAKAIMKNAGAGEINKMGGILKDLTQYQKETGAKIKQQEIVNKQQEERIGMERERLELSSELTGLEITEARARIASLGKEQSWKIVDPGDEFDHYILQQPSGSGSAIPKPQKGENADRKDMDIWQRRDLDIKRIKEEYKAKQPTSDGKRVSSNPKNKKNIERKLKAESLEAEMQSAIDLVEGRFQIELEGDQQRSSGGQGGPMDTYLNPQAANSAGYSLGKTTN